MIEKTRHFIAKLRSLSEPQKKIIFLAVMAIASLGMVLLALKFTRDSIGRASLSLKSFQEDSRESLFSNDLFDEFDEQISEDDDSSSVQTIDWKIYTDTVSGFSLEYPADMAVNKEAGQAFLGTILAKFGSDGPLQNDDIINICAKRCLAAPVDYQKNKLVLDSMPITISGMDARVTYTNEDGNYKAFVYFPQTPANTFTSFDASDISKGGWIGIKVKSQQIRDYIITSFKFVK